MSVCQGGSVHLAIAKKVNEKLGLNEDLFLYGNLIPDVDKNTKLQDMMHIITMINYLFQLCHKKR